MAIKIKNPGLFSTIQDVGRFGYQSKGFSPAGSIDYLSAMLANQIVGNDVNDSVIEMTLQGLSAKVLSDHVFSVVGGEMDIKINGQVFPTGRAIYVANGDFIEFGQIKDGLRAYYAVPGGFDIDSELGSHSTHVGSGVGGFDGRALKAGDYLKSGGNEEHSFHYVLQKNKIDHSHEIRIIKGPEYDRFTEESIKPLEKEEFKLSRESDRMGVRLRGGQLRTGDGSYDLISAPTQLGNIQVTKSGESIILLNDRQTSGGYPRIATVAKVDIPKIAQIKPDETITFNFIDIEEATELYIDLIDQIENREFLSFDNEHQYYRRIKTKKINKLLMG